MNEALDLKKEKYELKKDFSNTFLKDLEDIVEMCFKNPKAKKEHFITRDKLEVQLIKLLQSQKKFKKSESLKANLKAMALYDLSDCVTGKIKSIDFENQTVSYLDIFNKEKTKNLVDVTFFDAYSLEMQVFYEKQRRTYDNVDFKKTFEFLTTRGERKQETRLGYWIKP